MGDSTLPVGATCEHPEMYECCDGCGHWHCADCGLSFDEQFASPPFETDAERQIELTEQLVGMGSTN